MRIAAAILPAIALVGCMGGAIVERDIVAETGRVAVVSVVIPRIADTSKESNRAVLQAVADRALAKVQGGLKNARAWTVVDPVNVKSGQAFLSFGTLSEEDVAALFVSAEEQKTAREIDERELHQWKREFVGAKNLPVVPRSAFITKTGRMSRFSPVLRKHAARLCTVLNVDAVAFVHITATVNHPRPKTFIVSGNRTDGSIQAAGTMLMVDKKGRMIVDMGWPKPDGNARSRDLLPVYAGAGKDAVKPENIDLGDPKNKIVQAFFSLIDEATSDMVGNFEGAAGKK